MNFFESELRKLFGTSAPFTDTQFAGRVCIGRLGDTTNVKLEFVTTGTHEHYTGIRATVFNRNEGVIDNNLFLFDDVLGKKPISPSRPNELIKPYVWVYSGETSWYGFQPNAADYKKIAGNINGNLGSCKEPVQRTRETEKPSVIDTIRADKQKRQPGEKNTKSKNQTIGDR